MLLTSLRRGRVGILAGLFLVGGALAHAASTGATIERIGNFTRNAGLIYTYFVINDRGDVAGEFSGAQMPPTIWHRSAVGVETWIDVGVYHHRFGGLNENGELVYTSWKGAGSPLTLVGVYRFRPGIGVDLLVESIGVPVNTFGYTVSGQMTGMVGSPSGSGLRAVRYDPGVGFVDLGGPFPGGQQEGMAINASGQVAASVTAGNPNQSYAAVHTPGVGWRVIGSPRGGGTLVKGMNDHGDVVGGMRNPGGILQPFVAFHDQLTQSLGLFPGNTGGYGLDINNSGWVIGMSEYATPFLWTQETGLIDLQSLVPPSSGLSIENIYDINNRGQIVGVGRLESGFNSLPFVMTITSLPAPNIGDADGDGATNFTDLSLVLTNFGQSGAGLVGDVDQDGAVGFEDLSVVLASFGARR